jgi:signal transduction histidine kinase
MEQRRDVYLIYKESLNNIFKHAHAKTVWVKAGINHQTFELMIKDDGKGFKTDQPTFRNGLKNLRWRVEKWKGDFHIESMADKGTTITIRMPVGK